MAAKDLYEKDFYKVLGVDKKAPADEIKKKYRAMARDLHPDKTKGDVAKEEQFKAVSEAYEILSDPKKRAEYDEARSLFAKGGFRAPQGGGDFGDIFGSGNPQDIFANLFGAAGGRRGPRKGQDLQTEAVISFRESVFGTTLELRLGMDRGQSQNISARVPAGVNDGAKIRMKGKGSPGEAGPGDLFIQLHVKPHPIFGREGETKPTLSYWRSVCGCIPEISAATEITYTPAASSGWLFLFSSLFISSPCLQSQI